MKKAFFAISFALLSFVALPIMADAQKKEKKTVDAAAVTKPNATVDALKRGANSKKEVDKSRGDLYGPNYSDIIVDNYRGYYIDIYVDGSFRGTIAPYDKKTTWAVPGTTTLYAKAVFSDGSYTYWGPFTTTTGYAFTWGLH